MSPGPALEKFNDPRTPPACEAYPGKRCSLILGDCMEAVRSIPSGSVDMVLMDPPYSTPTIAAFGREKCKRLSDLAIQEYYFGALKPEIERILKPDGPLMVFCDDVYYAVLVGLFYEWKQINLLVWDKRRIGMGKPFRRRHECLLRLPRDSSDCRRNEPHPDNSGVPADKRTPRSRKAGGVVRADDP